VEEAKHGGAAVLDLHDLVAAHRNTVNRVNKYIQVRTQS